MMATPDDLIEVGDNCDNDEAVNHLEKEWEHLRTIRRTDGYREGLSAGKEARQQLGFNKGYEVGFASIQHMAELRGKLWGIIGMIQPKLSQEQQIQGIGQLQNIITELGTLEQEIVKDIQLHYSSYCEALSGSETIQANGHAVGNPEHCITVLPKEKQLQHQVQFDKIKQTCIAVFKYLNLNDSFIAQLKI